MVVEYLDEKQVKEMIENHWKYTEGIIRNALGKTHSNDPEIQSFLEKVRNEWIELCHYCYVKSGIHFFNHALESLGKDKYIKETDNEQLVGKE